MHDKMAISAYIFENSKKGPILRLMILSLDGVFKILFEIYLKFLVNLLC